jgi:hypothetical protein
MGLDQACTTYGPRARESFQSGPQSPNLCTFGLIFDVNTMQNRKKLNQFGPQMCEQHFLARMKSELCIPGLDQRSKMIIFESHLTTFEMS